MSTTAEELNMWGGNAWHELVDRALDFIGPLDGKHVLELGYRDGRMSCAFAHRGARVTGLEISAASISLANQRAASLGLSQQTEFLAYNGDLSSVPGQFDVVFTKSVLVLTDLAAMLPAIREKLRSGGRFAFVENADGGPLLRLARCCTRLPRTYRGVRYFTSAHVAMIRNAMHVDLVSSTRLPPVYLICGRR